jgi:UDP-glucose 4-epimerase
MRVLVTGGAGFIGSHLVDKLIKAGHKVVVVDDLSGGLKSNVNKKAKIYIHDLRGRSPSERDINQICREFKPEIIYHLAANAAENKAQFSPVDITSRNYDAFIRTLTAALKNKKGGFKRFIFTSSIAVYGGLQTPFKETDKPEPEDLYGISKLAAEETLEVLSNVHDFEYVITRPHNVYGPRQNMTDPYRNVVTIFMNALMKNQPYYIYGDGNQRRCFSYIDDVVDALYNCMVLDVNKKIFNVGADKDYSLNELSEVIQEIAGLEIPPKYIADRPQEVKVAVSDHTQSKKYLKYRDKTSLEEGIKNTWDYAKTLGPQEYEYTEIEIPSEKLPKNWKVK